VCTYLCWRQSVLPKSRENISGTFLPQINHHVNLQQHLCVTQSASQSINPEQGMGRWVMGQMGHENRMGHMGHGSLGQSDNHAVRESVNQSINQSAGQFFWPQIRKPEMPTCKVYETEDKAPKYGRIHEDDLTIQLSYVLKSLASVRLCPLRSQRALTLYPATNCAAATDISGVSGRWQ